MLAFFVPATARLYPPLPVFSGPTGWYVGKQVAATLRQASSGAAQCSGAGRTAAVVQIVLVFVAD